MITGQQKIELEEIRRKKLESRGSTLSPDDDLVNIRRGPLPEMRHLANLLDNEKIGTLLVGDLTTCGKDRFGNVIPTPTAYDLQVKSEDANEALQIIGEDYKKNTDLDQYDLSHSASVYNPQASEACCPACGHTFPTTERNCPDCGLSFG